LEKDHAAGCGIALANARTVVFSLAFLLAIVAVALVGGLVPAVTEAVAGSLLLGLFIAPRPGQPASSGVRDAAVLGVLAGLAVVTGFVAEDIACRTRQAARAVEAARAVAEADRIRAALLAAVSHDLRSPLASAKAAVSGLRAPDIRLTAADHDELLATADGSLGQLERLADSLPDVSRLQAGALPVFPRSAHLGEIVVSSLGELGPSARAIRVDVPWHLPEVMADPAITERIIVNVIGNALRYAPAGSPLRLTAGALGDRVELRIIDRGLGIPEADRDQAFVPFRRLGSAGRTVGVGLGLAVSRGLAEAMGGTLRAGETPGGGLTMVLSLPAAPPNSAPNANSGPVLAEPDRRAKFSAIRQANAAMNPAKAQPPDALRAR
jgi:two-component system, OmpR family, sensor histidine kinase KdpD